MTNYTPMPTRRPSEPKTYPVCSLKKALDIIKSKCGDVYVKERHGKGRNKVIILPEPEQELNSIISYGRRSPMNVYEQKLYGMGHFLGKLRQPCAVHHGGGNGADPVVLLGQVQQLMAEHGGKALPRRFQGLSGLHIEGAHAVVLPRLLLGVGVSLSLDGVHVQQHRPAHIPGQHQHLGQGLHIVAVHGTHIGKAHVFKHRAAGQQGFFQGRFHIVAHGVHPLAGLAAGEHLAIAPLELVILRRAAQPGQVPGQAAHVGVDGHAVVVEDHDQRLAAGSGVVEPLEAQTAAHGAVADQGQHMIVLPLQSPGPGHA